jgi:RNA recognition motif-containing protein
MDFVGMRVSKSSFYWAGQQTTNSMPYRIVEYATREQAQNAVATLSNQNLMGRLVYVREASSLATREERGGPLKPKQDREAEPRFGPPGAGAGAGAGGARGGFGGGMPGGYGGGGHGGGPGGFNAGGMAAGGGGRQIYVTNVCYIPPTQPYLLCIGLRC